ncbi:MAG: PIN domain-containing protein [Pirellulales bacterium]|nr:PIN domain-containing protein [Pirellulales bacterium]
MRYLVDANVLSESCKPAPQEQVLEWVQAHERELAINPVVLGELEFGVLSLPRGQRRDRLAAWLAQTARFLHVLPLDKRSAYVWAQLLSDLRQKGRAMPVKDSLIAATALQHGLIVATRNVSDYRYSGVEIVNPFVMRT